MFIKPHFQHYSLNFQGTVNITPEAPPLGDKSLMPEGSRFNNSSDLFRTPKLFKALPDFLNSRYPTGVPIYVYASSDGSDAISTVIALIEKLSEEKAKKFLPIYARELIPELSAIAESGKFGMYPFEWYYGVREIGINVLQNKYFSLYPRVEGVPSDVPFQVGPEEKVLIEFDDYKGEHNQPPILKYFQPVLKDNIEFSSGDISEDILDHEFKKGPIVLFFRNAWYHLQDREKKIDLAKRLYDNLQHRSLLIVGKFDINVDDTHWPNKGDNMTRILQSVGFKPVQNETLKPYVFEKP